MAQSTFNTDIYVAGNISSKTWTPPAASVTDAAIVGAAGVQASKLQHQYEDTYVNTNAATTAASEQKVLRVICGLTGILTDFKAGCVVVCAGAATITVDLWKNGSTILTAVITLNNTQSARQLVTAAGFTSNTVAVGDVLEVNVVATAGGGTIGKGCFARLNMREDAQ